MSLKYRDKDYEYSTAKNLIDRKYTLKDVFGMDYLDIEMFLENSKIIASGNEYEDRLTTYKILSELELTKKTDDVSSLDKYRDLFLMNDSDVIMKLFERAPGIIYYSKNLTRLDAICIIMLVDNPFDNVPVSLTYDLVKHMTRVQTNTLVVRIKDENTKDRINTMRDYIVYKPVRNYSAYAYTFIEVYNSTDEEISRFLEENNIIQGGNPVDDRFMVLEIMNEMELVADFTFTFESEKYFKSILDLDDEVLFGYRYRA